MNGNINGFRKDQMLHVSNDILRRYQILILRGTPASTQPPSVKTVAKYWLKYTNEEMTH